MEKTTCETDEVAIPVDKKVELKENRIVMNWSRSCSSLGIWEGLKYSQDYLNHWGQCRRVIEFGLKKWSLRQRTTWFRRLHVEAYRHFHIKLYRLWLLPEFAEKLWHLGPVDCRSKADYPLPRVKLLTHVLVSNLNPRSLKEGEGVERTPPPFDFFGLKSERLD